MTLCRYQVCSGNENILNVGLYSFGFYVFIFLKFSTIHGTVIVPITITIDEFSITLSHGDPGLHCTLIGTLTTPVL